MIKSSKLCAFLRALAAAFLDSRLYGVLLGIVNFFADAYADSTLRKKLLGKGAIERYAADSALYRFFGKISGGIIGFFAGFCGFVGKNASDSVVNRLYSLFFKRSFYQNYLAFTAFVCVIIFAIPHNFWFNPFGLLFAALLVVLYFMAASDTDKARAPGRHFGAVWFSLIVFTFSLFVSCFVSYDRGDSIRVLMFFATSLVLCMVMYASIRSAEGLNTVGGFLYGVLIFTSVIAFVQRILGVEADASLTDLTLNADMPGRVFSTLANPNNYAEFLVLFMPFAFAYALNCKKGTAKRGLLIVGMFLPLGAILLTYSRSGWIALAIAAVIFVALYDRKLIPVFIILALFAIPFIPRNILNRILTIGNLKDTSSSYRVDIWKGCLAMLKDYWFTGVGLGTGGFAAIYPPYAFGESGIAPHSHMHFMEMLCELGVLGFVSYISLTFSLIRRSFTAAAKRVPKELRLYAIAAAASMTGIVLIGCFEYCWFYPRVMFAFFICAGISMAVYRLAVVKGEK